MDPLAVHEGLPGPLSSDLGLLLIALVVLFVVAVIAQKVLSIAKKVLYIAVLAVAVFLVLGVLGFA